MITRVFADGVRLYATAIPIAIIFKGYNMFTNTPDWQIYSIAIILMAIITLIYTYIGGVRAVIWTDVIQMFIYIGGGVLALIVLNSFTNINFSDSIAKLSGTGKLEFFNFYPGS